jgi:DNA primase RepB-like protein
VSVDHEAAIEFLRIGYQHDDWVAIFLKSYESGRVGQRVVPVSLAMTARFQEWLSKENGAGVNIYVTVNVVKPRQASRRRASITTIRHIFLDADRDGARMLDVIGGRTDLPPISHVLHSSPGRLHVFWQAAGFTIEHAEGLQKRLASELAADRAATACSQLTRLPGFLNHKYRPPHHITMEYRCRHHVYTPGDFPLPLPVGRQEVRTTLARSSSAEGRRLERARQYVAAVPPAISGQHGDVQTFRVCCRLTRGFALSDEDAMTVLTDWNARCQPPWSDRELVDKLRRARRYGREPVGGLLEGHP